jgi:hypothetical protein
MSQLHLFLSPRVVLVLLWNLLSIALLFGLGYWARNSNWGVSTGSAYLDFQMRYQLSLLPVVALLFWGLKYWTNDGSWGWPGMGQLHAPAGAIRWMGIREGDSWWKTGISLSVVITAATAFFMYGLLRQHEVDYSRWLPGLGWVLLFSAMNACAEEMIFRVHLVLPLKGVLPFHTLCLLSAVCFGLPHLAGMPSGFIGALMAGLLGYILAKSLLETGGIFWAWWIHFLQDIVIIGVLFLTSE